MDGLGFALFEDVGVGLGGGVDAGVSEALGDNFEIFAGLQLYVIQ